MELTAKNVARVLKSYFEDDYGYGGFWSGVHYEMPSGGIDGQGVHIDLVTSFGGEGQGDTAWIVVKATDGDTTKFFRKDGYYASYDGFTWDGDFAAVTPQEKTITVYEAREGSDVFDGYATLDSFDEEDSFQ